ncbi:MAG: thymidylate kinase [Candidatus Bathyarchaeia archaeon]|jgi:thymidylate kinase
MPIICFFGSDGSGKTTLSRFLAERLKDDEFKVKLSWMRGTHTLASVLALFFSKCKVFQGSDNPYYKIAVPKPLRRLWQLIEFVSMLPVLLAKFLLPNAFGYTVIAERYLLDFVAWVATTTNNQGYLKSLDAHFLIALTFKATVRVYVTADFSELVRRRADTSPVFIRNQQKLYCKLATAVDAYTLDTTNKSVNESAVMLFAFVKQTLERAI